MICSILGSLARSSRLRTSTAWADIAEHLSRSWWRGTSPSRAEARISWRVVPDRQPIFRDHPLVFAGFGGRVDGDGLTVVIQVTARPSGRRYGPLANYRCET